MTASDEVLNTIRVASVQLEPANDDHWTAEGLPALEVIQQLTGNAKIKRGDITHALPDLTRESRAAAPVFTADPPVEAGPKSRVDANGFVIPSDDHTAAELELSAEELDTLIHACVDRVAVARELTAEAKAEIQAAEDEHARLVGLKNRLYPPLTFEQNVRMHLDAVVGRDAERASMQIKMREDLVKAGVLAPEPPKQ